MGECFLQNFCCIFVLLIQLEIHFFGPKTQHLKLQPNAKNAIWNWQSCMFRKPSKYKASQEVEVYLTAKLMRASLCMWMFHVTIKASNLHQIPHEYAITNLGYKSKEHNFQCLEIIKEQQPTEMRVLKQLKEIWNLFQIVIIILILRPQSISNRRVKHKILSTLESKPIKQATVHSLMDSLYLEFFLTHEQQLNQLLGYCSFFKNFFFFYYNHQILNKKMLEDV